MAEILTNPNFPELVTSLTAGDLNLMTELVWIVLATVLSMVGGAIGGMLLAGKDIGYQFSAMLGGLFAPAGVIPAIILGLFLLNLLTKF